MVSWGTSFFGIVDLELLINAVRKRISLYDDRLNPNEPDVKLVKKHLWSEVYREVYTDAVWDRLTRQQKVQFGIELQKKWASLRRGYKRELAFQMSAVESKRKGKKFVYYNSLQFLEPYTTVELNTHKGKSDDDAKPAICVEETSAEQLKVVKKETKAIPETATNETDDDDVKCLADEREVTPSQWRDDPDEDESFLKSLLPTIKRFKDNDKLLLRIELLKTVVNFKKPGNTINGVPYPIQTVTKVEEYGEISDTSSSSGNNG